MAFNKKQISYTLTAILISGVMISEGVGLYKLNQQVKTLQQNKAKLEKTIDNLNKSIEEKDSTIDNVTEERDNNKESLGKLQKENEVLNEKLESKKKEEATALQLASADYPTSVSRGNINKGTPVKITLTFYGDGAEENGGYAGINAYSQKLSAGMVASNVYPRGTKFITPNGQTLSVQDKGGSHFNSYNRLDVFVPKNPGESTSSYNKRISNLGRKTITLYKI